MQEPLDSENAEQMNSLHCFPDFSHELTWLGKEVIRYPTVR